MLKKPVHWFFWGFFNNGLDVAFVQSSQDSSTFQVSRLRNKLRWRGNFIHMAGLITS